MQGAHAIASDSISCHLQTVHAKDCPFLSPPLTWTFFSAAVLQRGCWSQFDDGGAVFSIAWGFKWGLSMLEACHTSWVKSKVTGLLKDWRSDANCHRTLQKPRHAKLQFTGCLSSLQWKSYNQSGTLIVDTIYSFGEEVVCLYFNGFITLAGTLPPVQM